jgi:hypothetical protein
MVRKNHLGVPGVGFMMKIATIYQLIGELFVYAQ